MVLPPENSCAAMPVQAAAPTLSLVPPRMLVKVLYAKVVFIIKCTKALYRASFKLKVGQSMQNLQSPVSPGPPIKSSALVLEMRLCG